MTVAVESSGGTRHPDMPVYLFDGETYLNRTAVTDEDGLAVFVLAEGAYRFRADLFGVPFRSAEENDCLIPGCTAVTVLVPGAEGVAATSSARLTTSTTRSTG
ncbi:MAG: hypothetical protein HYZ26_09650 [Chloroflexi bacterium]|nr:hypothetical protein [Chloroflexota bacterium]